MVLRGVIRHRDRAQQILDYSGLTYGSITPTDIDGLIEFKNKAFLWLEFKHQGKPDLDRGQELAFERLCMNTKKPTLLLVALHNEPVERDIYAADCIVHRYLWRGEWTFPVNPITVKQMVDRFFAKHGR